MLPALFAITLFVGAALLFLVQPLVGKLLLPMVGGSPGVWNTCMVFFQAVLLAGYLYAHRSTGQLGVRRQALVHLTLLVIVLLTFKIGFAATGSPVPVFRSLIPDDQDYPIFGLVALLAVAVGIPFFILSTTSPLLQRWFAATKHPSARDPYFLYAASNAGSLLGLLGYPLLIEPRLTLATQQWVFACGVGVYLLLVVVCAVIVIRNVAEQETQNGEGTKETAANGDQKLSDSGLTPSAPSPLPVSRVLRWVFLSALTSSLLLGVTTHVSTDLAPVPLLWVVPLALYLLSFILVFARWPEGVHRAVGRTTPFLLLFVVLSLLLGAAEPFGLICALHLGAFMGVCLVCHGELARDRPPPQYLTAFYFWLSLGGVLGGMANALVAPVVFHRVGMVEYPLALIIAAIIRPRNEEPIPGPPLRVADVALVLGLLGLSLGLVFVVPQFVSVPIGSPDDADANAARILRGGLMFGLPAVGAFMLVRRPARYALSLAALFVAGAFDPGLLGETLHVERNFFGVVRVTRSPDGKFIRLIHGTTMHGQQRADEPGRPHPLTYYHENGPVGVMFSHLSPEKVKRVGVIGLGTGAMAYYAQPGQNWTFYEIDPAVERIAREYFRFLSTCEADSCNVVLGDARRQLGRVPDGSFDLIVLDGFCSDAIPVHLLTREALQLYFQKLAPGGILAVHLSSVHLDLPPLVARLAADHDPPLTARYRHEPTSKIDRAAGNADAEWMILARTEADLAEQTRKGYWSEVPVVPGPVWRDDFANLLWVWKRKTE